MSEYKRIDESDYADALLQDCEKVSGKQMHRAFKKLEDCECDTYRTALEEIRESKCQEKCAGCAEKTKIANTALQGNNVSYPLSQNEADKTDIKD